MIFPYYLRSLVCLRNEKRVGSALHKKQKNNEALFSLAWNIIFSNNLKVVLKSLESKDMVFLSQKVDGNMMFTDY